MSPPDPPPSRSAIGSPIVIAISSRALFDLDEANEVFEREGLDAYRRFQVEREEQPLAPGTGFDLVRRLTALARTPGVPELELVLVSRNDPDTGLRVMNSAEHHGLAIARVAFTDGRPADVYLGAFAADLFLSAHEEDVRRALELGFAAGVVYPTPKDRPNGLSASRSPQADQGSSPSAAAEPPGGNENEVRIAFDGDAVLFSPAAERTYRERGLAAFHRQEAEAAHVPLEAGPFARFLAAVHRLQSAFPEESCPIRTALVTARSAPAHKRAIHTLRAWGVRIDEAFFLGGMPKSGILRAFAPDIYFDDHVGHCEGAAGTVPTARVPSDG
jgi:5'-nucleotidase